MTYLHYHTPRWWKQIPNMAGTIIRKQDPLSKIMIQQQIRETTEEFVARAKSVAHRFPDTRIVLKWYGVVLDA